MSDATVTVKNSHSHALTIRLYKQTKDEYGVNAMARDGDEIVLNPGHNEGVDKAFIEAWLEQNKNTNFVKVIEIV